MMPSTTDNQTAIEEVVGAFLSRRTGIASIDPATHLFDSGLMTSLFVLELVTFLESRFDLHVTIDDLDLERFSTIENVASFVAQKKTVLS